MTLYVFALVCGAVVGFVLGVVFTSRRATALIQQQPRNLYNALMPYVLGEGASAQVCIPVNRLAKALGVKANG